MVSAQALIDFAFCLGLLTLLVACYGSLRRRLPGTALAPQLLGLLFGGVAALMMHVPLVLADGVLVDLRVVPVVLAGAFLGLRGAMIAVAVAMAMRLQIGGVGWFSGVTVIWTAAAIGLAWSFATIGPAHRGVRSMVALGAASCLTLGCAALMPFAVAARFLTETGPLLAAVYMLVVPSLALLLEHQRVAMQREAWEREAAGARSEAPFDGPERLTLALTAAEASGRFSGDVVVLALRVRSGRIALSLWGAEVELAVLRALRERLASLLPRGSEMGMVEHGTVLVFLEAPEDGDPAAIAEALCREASDAPFAVPGMASVRLRLDGRGVRFDALPTYHEIDRAFDPAAARAARGVAAAQARSGTASSNVARLFRTADRLFEVRAIERMAGPQDPRRARRAPLHRLRPPAI